MKVKKILGVLFFAISLILLQKMIFAKSTVKAPKQGYSININK